MLRRLSAEVSESSVAHPFFKDGNPAAVPGVILMTADKGLAGAFNSNVIRAAESYAQQNHGATFYTIGIKARNAVRRMGQSEHPTWTLAGDKLETARAVAARAGEDFAEGRISRLVLISSRFISMMSQKPEVIPLLRVPRHFVVSPAGRESEKPQLRGAVEFLPSPEFVLARLLPKYLEFTIFSTMLETDAAFFAAQLIAMSNATDNAGKAIDELTIAMNNARQAAITKELLEVVAGAEALAG